MYRKKLNRREDEMVSMVEDLFREIELYAEDEATKTRLLVLLCFMHGSFFCAVPSASRKKEESKDSLNGRFPVFVFLTMQWGRQKHSRSTNCPSAVSHTLWFTFHCFSMLFLSFFSFPGMIMSLDFLLWSGSSSPSATFALEA